MSLSIRRLNPLLWSLKTINIVFVSLLTLLTAAYILSSTTTLAQEPPIALLSISDIDLTAEIIAAPPQGRDLPTPDRQVGLYQPHEDLTFLYGHNTTVFGDLGKLKVTDSIDFKDLETGDITSYQITKITTQPTSAVRMSTLLSAPNTKTLILMTCAGEFNPSIDTYDDRLIIWAETV